MHCKIELYCNFVDEICLNNCGEFKLNNFVNNNIEIIFLEEFFLTQSDLIFWRNYYWELKKRGVVETFSFLFALQVAMMRFGGMVFFRLCCAIVKYKDFCFFLCSCGTSTVPRCGVEEKEKVRGIRRSWPLGYGATKRGGCLKVDSKYV